MLTDPLLALRPLKGLIIIDEVQRRPGTARAIESHPKVGASWEGFAVHSVVARLGARPDECFFWATHTGAELDLLVVRGHRRVGFKFKLTTAPTITRSMRVAIEDLRLSTLYVVHAGMRSYDLDRKIRAIAIEQVLDELHPLR